jgi:hypothetical protein
MKREYRGALVSILQKFVSTASTVKSTSLTQASVVDETSGDRIVESYKYIQGE